MVGIQFVMSMSFSIPSPIMPLFLPELGVHSAQAIDLWAGDRFGHLVHRHLHRADLGPPGRPATGAS